MSENVIDTVLILVMAIGFAAGFVMGLIYADYKRWEKVKKNINDEDEWQ